MATIVPRVHRCVWFCVQRVHSLCVSSVRVCVLNHGALPSQKQLS